MIGADPSAGYSWKEQILYCYERDAGFATLLTGEGVGANIMACRANCWEELNRSGRANQITRSEAELI